MKVRRLIVDKGTSPHEIFTGQKDDAAVKDGAIEVMRLLVVDVILDLTLEDGKGFSNLFVLEMSCDELLLNVGTIREILHFRNVDGLCQHARGTFIFEIHHQTDLQQRGIKRERER